MRAFALLLVLAGCAASGSSVEEREVAGLDRELSSRVAGEPGSCAPASQIRGMAIVDRRTVTIDDGNTLWVNRLAADCPGLRPTSTIIADVHGDRYCRGDRIRALEPGTTIPGPYCILADWTPYRRPR